MIFAHSKEKTEYCQPHPLDGLSTLKNLKLKAEIVVLH